ncbi:MAG: Rossmann-like and DUF2520 domain-containing protein [Brumimicrobium sp.]
MDKLKNIIIIGTGKVAQQLGSAIAKGNVNIVGVWGRTSENAEKLAQSLNTLYFTKLSEISIDCLALICVSDGAIEEVLSQIPEDIKVAYTSGSVKLTDLPERENIGVFYPLQTFSEGSNVNINEVPFLIEANNQNFEKELQILASSISETVLIANSADRYNIHIAAVMVNNFTNFLYYLASEHLSDHDLDFDLLRPLIKETVNKLEYISPLNAQTGPAVRGDIKVINSHINSLNSPDVKELYKLFSNMIMKTIQSK